MCGIAGLYDPRGGLSAEALSAAAANMAATLRHRGPDDDGVWVDAEAGLAFGHRRLSIIDLSSAGHQPMVSAGGRYVIVYNGEAYNTEELRDDLTEHGLDFRGHSDTEVLLEACATWGVESTLARLNGMFAFALWDRERRRLVLARDHLGIKPLYWGRFGRLLLFGSELKALRAHSGWRPQLDRAAAAAYFRFGYVPAPHSIYAGVRKLPAGCLLSLEAEGEPEVSRYWDLRAVAASGQASLLQTAEADLITELDDLLRDSVGRQMLADVPLGAFLSGGIDSSTVVSLMQAQSTRPIQTFTIGFHEASYDEARHARAVARHLGTEHTELYVTPEDARAVIPDLPQWFDEPFADSSQIPTHLVSHLARQRLTVALSGDGGDESFAGYNRHRWLSSLWRGLGPVPAPIRRLGGTLLALPSPAAWDAALSWMPARVRTPQVGEKIHKIAGLLDLSRPEDMYLQLISHWPTPAQLLPEAREPDNIIADDSLPDALPDITARLQYLDMATYLPDDILTKVDRSTMAASLEVRVPLLDHRVVEFAFRLPKEAKLRNGRTKWLLRQVLNRYVPEKLVERPKAGFAVPIDAWLRGPLRDWAENLLSDSRLRQDGLLEPTPVREAWAAHLSGRRNEQHRLWVVLMFQAWRERWQL